MVSKINFKAKIRRHSRIIKHNISNIHPIKKLYNRFGLNSLFFIVVFLFPIYPSFSNFIYGDIIYRGYIDESSIIDSYTESREDFVNDSFLISSPDSFISVNDIIDGELGKEEEINNKQEIVENESKDSKKTDIKKDKIRKDIITYEVNSGDTISKIALKFGVSNDSILWANNLSEKSVLKPGQKIKIPPVSGVVYEIKSGDTIGGLAAKYKIDIEKILLQNGIENPSNIKIGQVIIIPGATQISESKTSSNLANKNGYSFSSKDNSSFTNENGSYKLIKRKAKWKFVPGNCTWFVAQYKNVTWSGNAKNWLHNAKAKGVPTGTEPSIGAIVVFNGRGYNPYYGHVGIVVGISGGNLIIKDMNYRRLYEVTTRKVSINDRSIRGYIYVD